METQKVEKIESQQHQQLEVHKGTTFLRTCVNGLNALSGVGILSIPYALSEGGWLSLIFLLVTAIVLCYTGLLLRRCMDAHSQIRTYPDIGELAFGYKGRVLVALFMYLELYLVAVEFLILEGDNLNKLFPNMGFKVGGMKIGGKQGFTVLASVIILPTTWLRNLGLFAYVSAGGVLASAIVVASVFWAGAVDGVGFHERGRLVNWSGMPTAISLYAFCYCGHAVFPTLCTSMKERILGYLMYGEGLKSQVTLNLPVGKFSSNIAIYTTLINPFTKYAIMITPIAAALEDWFPFRNNRSISILIRTVLVISTVVMALVVPFFGYLMALIGAFLSITVSVLLPCVCYLKISKDLCSLGFELAVIVSILVTGSLVAISGTYSSVRQIINHL
ncbi:hypothetical protein IFM89_031306 [Coptis chinensis]|uniref:Amino acid transporter transmembrane domain-containing protein n=1 Tax=Coptis chinensis TaxID=261450 RepID=A0A835IYQ0_9MAGN|nr:hypothetical protein IFM89_031306 [Coptis chinensis]